MDNINKKIERFLKERGWDNLSPADIAKSISIEAAELLEIFQWSNPKASEVKADKDKTEKIKNELADVIIYSMELAGLLGIDAKKAVLKKIERNSKKYPAILMKKKKGDNPDLDSYFKIKEDYRRKGI